MNQFKTLQELFADPKRWTKGVMHAKPVGGCDCYCLSGGIYTIYSQDTGEIFERIREHLHIRRIVDWNDAPERTIEEVQEVCRILNI